MIPCNIKQKQQIAILTKKDKQYKAELVISETNDQSKNSTNDLSYTQANNIISKLGGNPVKYYNWAYYDKTKKSHKYILSLCIQYGWFLIHDKYGEIADLNKFSNWLKSDKSPVKKPLKEMSSIETSKIITALESMVTKQYN